MTRRGPAKAVEAGYAQRRLAVARAYLEAARKDVLLAEPGDLANPAISAIVHSAIAFTDAVTAEHIGKVNSQDHSAAPRLLRDALGRHLPDSQERRLQRILDAKDAAEYGARGIPMAEAERLLELLNEYAIWAEAVLA